MYLSDTSLNLVGSGILFAVVPVAYGDEIPWVSVASCFVFGCLEDTGEAFKHSV